MGKIIETHRESLIVCDNESCDYTVPFTEEAGAMKKYINQPCPECGENLLTQKDYELDQKVLRRINWINKYFGWITIFTSKKSNKKNKVISVKVHDKITVSEEPKKTSIWVYLLSIPALLIIIPSMIITTILLSQSGKIEFKWYVNLMFLAMVLLFAYYCLK
jgi:hypothetical protein